MHNRGEKMKLVSIVVPVFNEEENIQMFYREVCKYMDPLPYQFELIFVDDGSKDGTPLLLEKLAQQDSRVRGLILARNFGHQLASIAEASQCSPLFQCLQLETVHFTPVNIISPPFFQT
jgi:cellulose synthase/poly-beta-1,6-N-acetylglucosamine synthase-like glycosyltransferase